MVQDYISGRGYRLDTFCSNIQIKFKNCTGLGFMKFKIIKVAKIRVQDHNFIQCMKMNRTQIKLAAQQSAHRKVCI